MARWLWIKVVVVPLAYAVYLLSGLKVSIWSFYCLLAMHDLINLAEVMKAEEIEKLLPIKDKPRSQPRTVPYPINLKNALIKRVVDGLIEAYQDNFEKLTMLLEVPWIIGDDFFNSETTPSQAKKVWVEDLPTLSRILSTMAIIARREDRAGLCSQWGIVYKYANYHGYKSTPETNKAFDAIKAIAEESGGNLLEKATDAASAIDVWELAQEAFLDWDNKELQPFWQRIIEFTGKQEEGVIAVVRAYRPQNWYLLKRLLRDTGTNVDDKYCQKAMGLRA